jgi:hypothetical protein
MKNREVAEEFVNGSSKAEGSNMFIEGNKLFSYGYHFPIAVRLISGEGFKYIWNKSSYSRTTSTHKGYVRRLISDNDILKEVSTNEMGYYTTFKTVQELMMSRL